MLHRLPQSASHPSCLARSLLRSRAFYVFGMGVLLGMALQLHRAQLLAASSNVALLLGAGLLVAWVVLWGRYALGSPPAQQPKRQAHSLVILLMLGVLSLVMGYAYTGLRALAVQGKQLAPALEGQALPLSGHITSMVQPTEWGVRFQFRLSDPPPGVPPLLSVHWNGGATQEAQTEPTQQDERTTWQLGARPPALAPGDAWRFTLRLKAIHAQHNPGGFDGELWAWEQGLGASASVLAHQAAQAPEHQGSNVWVAPVERLRQQFRDRLLAYLQNDANPADASAARWAGVLAALLVGDQAAIARTDWDVFRTTGVAHLVSISGLHITMFAWLARRGLRGLWQRRPVWNLRWPSPVVGAIGGWLCAAFYALLSGWGLPAQRTVGMLACVLGLRLGGRRWPWPRVWLSVLLWVTLADPWALLSAGFWLSFVAVAVLFASDAAPGSQAATGSQAEGRAWHGRWVPELLALVKEQWVITLALAPLTLMLFQQQSLSGLVANLFAVPWVTLVITPLCMIGLLVPLAWSGASLAVQGLVAGLQVVADWPFASVNVAAAPFALSVLGLLGAMALVLPLPWHLRAMACPPVLMVLLWQAPRPPAGQFEVNFTDIGQGNAVVVRTRSHTLVYDSGPRYSSEADAGHRVLLPVLRWTAEAPDLLIVSHQDNDHSGGAGSLLSAFPALAFLSSLPAHHQAARYKSPERCFQAAQGGQAWQWDGVQFEVLHPRLEDYKQPTVRTNALSCVLRISNGQHTVLLVGDIEAAQEERLVQEAAPKLRADVLLVPHHGSKTSSSGVFLDAVAPKWAVVQAAYRNRYGHPAPRILQRYAVRGIHVLDSPHCGAALWQSSQAARFQCSRQVDARYWHHQVP